MNHFSGITYTVGDDVGVAVQTPLGVTVRGLVAGQVPDDEGLVAGARKEHVRAGNLLVRCRSGYPHGGELTSPERSPGR